ncbi:hypothetical protein N7532_009153 [Penicillium argentinense]|uniref:CENP-V/GFA domain-containing protein n=1 Tax=Penicillium argentinense TaxID=1131581 RepID=A0A9W9EYN9_9EURO|nr:uncharacterized protein N7532_009153 [Penicillium argentinense]KAJ5090469.1 hypothetical protein N7532_009153 [Penicillium argentinense]
MPSGSCFCGNLKYEFAGEPQAMALCYCLSCQKISGSTHTANFMVPGDTFHLTTGLEKTCTQRHETGMNLTVHFCDKCGGIIYKTADNAEFSGMAVVQAGTVDDLDLVQKTKPAMELFTKYRAPWIQELEGVAQKSEF